MAALGRTTMRPRPALRLWDEPGRRRDMLTLAQRIEEEGFTGIYCPSMGDAVGLCQAIALSTRDIRVGTNVALTGVRDVHDYARTAAQIHELSGGRFDFGVGLGSVARERFAALGQGPLAAMRDFAVRFKEAATAPGVGELPPLIIASLRQRMVALAAEVADGCAWANAARSHLPASLSVIPAEKRAAGFKVVNVLRMCIDDDKQAAAAVVKSRLVGYLHQPQYRRYWREAGYIEEMDAIEAALATGERDRLPDLMSDRWLSDVALYGRVREVRDAVEAWYEAGVTVLSIDPMATSGRIEDAFESAFFAFQFMDPELYGR